MSFIIQIASIAAFVLLANRYPERKGGWALTAAAAVISAAFLLVSFALIQVLGWGDQFELLWIGVQLLLTVGATVLLNRCRLKTKLLMIFSQMTCLSVVQQSVNCASRLVSFYGGADSIHWLLRSTASLLLIPCALLLRRWNTDRDAHIPLSSVLLTATLTGTALWLDSWVTLCGEYQTLMGSRGSLVLLLSILLVLLLLNLILCYLLHRFCVLREQVAELQISVRDRKRIEELMAVS